MALLEVINLRKQIDENIIVDDISFTQNTFEKIAIAGESGAGKTTLLKMIAAHAQPTSGTILFDGERVIGPNEKLLPGHKKIAYLSQHYALRNNYRIEELIAIENKLSDDDSSKLFAICRISHLLQHRTDELSGGEKQRIALCMLLVNKPVFLLLDEPFSNLDPIHTEILKTVLEEMSAELKITCLLTSHEPNDTLSWADKILVMRKGKIIQQGTPQEIYYKPLNEYVAGMFGKYNLLTPEQAKLFGIETEEKNVMVRPENFIVNATSDGVKCIVEKINFCGSFYEAEILAEDIKIVTRLLNNEWKIGDNLFVKVNSCHLLTCTSE